MIFIIKGFRTIVDCGNNSKDEGGNNNKDEENSPKTLNELFIINFWYLTVCKQKTVLILNWIVGNFYQNDLIQS